MLREDYLQEHEVAKSDPKRAFGAGGLSSAGKSSKTNSVQRWAERYRAAIQSPTPNGQIAPRFHYNTIGPHRGGTGRDFGYFRC